MKTHAAATCLLFAFTVVAPAMAAAPEPSTNQNVIDAVKKVENDLGDAMVAGDVARLDQIYAADFASIGGSGKVYDKASVLRDVTSGSEKLLWFENGPIDIQVFGNVAVAHGCTSEKRYQNGKEDSGQVIWMDLLEKRGSDWVITRSAGAKVR
jgi:Domain of unknown function (DUF4440)